ncbi:isochorismate synthase [Scopulibacillus cellulosilyticus]|uniref:isochorismate synthase n=1 Tax=Scopulibacillus cellulosilyticus TaxID=2665665 RepID=A0ABW2PR35_9BACL
MIIVKQLELLDCLKEGCQKAKKLSKQILVSFTKRLGTAVSPIEFFDNGRHSFQGTRMYWSDTQGMIMVGMGAAVKYPAGTGNRTLTVEKAWKKTLEDALHYGEKQLRGTGPVLMGGFSFDPLQENSSLWENFRQNEFIVPQFLLTKNQNEHYLTVTALISEQTEINHYYKQIKEKYNELTSRVSGCINYKEESLNIIEDQRDQWLDIVEKAIADINNGLMEKVVLSRTLTVSRETPFCTAEVLRRLQEKQADSFIFAVEKGNAVFIGATPERLIEKSGPQFRTMCLAGTIARGKTMEQDRQLGEELLNDKKNISEHQTVVNMISDVMERLCQSVNKPSSPALYKVKDVQHLYTPIIAEAKNNISLFSFVDELHPTPALGGEPKEKAVKWIRENETYERGWYGSPLGWIDSQGDGEFGVAIRSALIKENKATLFVGCGIVEDSDPLSELNETLMKARPMLTALGGHLK